MCDSERVAVKTPADPHDCRSNWRRERVCAVCWGHASPPLHVCNCKGILSSSLYAIQCLLGWGIRSGRLYDHAHRRIQQCGQLAALCSPHLRQLHGLSSSYNFLRARTLRLRQVGLETLQFSLQSGKQLL